jgi:ZIP family zinc transporter
MTNSSFGMTLALAMTCHNIPEGMCVAIPILVATNRKEIALKWTFVNGLFEPLAVIICSLIFGDDVSLMNMVLLNKILAAVAGIMTFVSCYELMPSCLKYAGVWRSVMSIGGGLICGYFVTSVFHH